MSNVWHPLPPGVTFVVGVICGFWLCALAVMAMDALQRRNEDAKWDDRDVCQSCGQVADFDNYFLATCPKCGGKASSRVCRFHNYKWEFKQ